MRDLLSAKQLRVLRDAAVQREVTSVERELGTGEYSRANHLDQCNRELATEFDGATRRSRKRHGFLAKIIGVVLIVLLVWILAG